MTCFPWGECKLDETKSSQTYVIQTISHITHKTNATKIEAGATKFNFKPAEKYGKCGYEVTDGSPLGESYRCNLKRRTPTAETEYIRIAHDQLVLPDGYYSWWGASTVNHSMYGTEKLTTSFRSALGKFKWCQKDPNEEKPPEVYLRVGGTLRYRKEICYVIIVHTETEASAEIEALPPLRSNAHFKLNGFLDARGRVINWDVTPTFVRRFYSDGCYDQFAFAFYFDDCEKPLCLENVKQSSVTHTKCLRSVLPKGATEWCCPERIPKN